MASARLRIARRNTAYLLFFVYVQDVFWLCLSRSGLVESRAYDVSPFDWLYVLLFVAISLLFGGVAVLVSCFARPLPRIAVPRSITILIILSGIASNVLSMVVVEPAARYSAGQFTVFSWAVYVLSNAISLSAVMLAIREDDAGRCIPKVIQVLLLVSVGVTIDGLASALTLFMYAFLLFGAGKLKLKQVVFGGIFAVSMFVVGVSAKFKELPSYVDGEFLLQWGIARVAIQSEQMYTLISGRSVIGSEISYLDLVVRALSNRVDLVAGKQVEVERPKNVAEAMSRDMHGSYKDSGSSPGLLVSTVLQGPFFFIVVPVFYVVLFMQHFYGVSRHLSLIHIIAYSFCFKVLHSNFPGYFAIISPQAITLVVFFITCLIVGSNRDVKPEERRFLAV